MNISELKKVVRAPGVVLLPTLIPHDVLHIQTNKADLLDALKNYDLNDASPWNVSKVREIDGITTTWLDVA